MVSSDANSLLEPVSADAPCGVDLESSAIAELDRLALGRAEQQMGSTVVAAEPPDWKQVRTSAIQILGRSKDLRAACQLTKAWLRTDGWSGLALGFEVLSGLIERYWQGLFPLLDPEDDNDPTMRVNILVGLADPAFVSAIRATPLLASRTMGRFALKEVEAASSEGTSSEASGAGSTVMASIEAAGMECDLQVLQQTAADLRSCVAGLAALEAALSRQVETGRLPSFSLLTVPVAKADAFMRSMVARRVPSASTEAMAESGPSAPPATAGPTGGTWTGGIRSRDDVVKALDAIVAYYAKNEPSSPIPIFMARCKRLVMMGFVDIVRELVPDALSQVDVLRGRVEDQ